MYNLEIYMVSKCVYIILNMHPKRRKLRVVFLNFRINVKTKARGKVRPKVRVETRTRVVV